MMAKGRQSLEAKLARLRSLRGAASGPEAVKELRVALGDASNFVVADAASIVGEAHIAELAPALVAAFERFFDNPVKTDKLCKAKLALAEALNQLEFDEEDIFWKGARYVQFEPVWGGQQDTAAPLRVACAFALVRLHARDVLPLLVDLLCDPEKTARAGAAQALAYSESETAALLLRLKARIGDPEPDVISECFNGILKLAPADGVTFVAQFLESVDLGVQESAILALGDSRRREALEVLKTFWEKPCDAQLRETVLMAVSLLRLPAATEFLLGLVGSEEQAVAWAAISALALHRYDARLRERTEDAVSRNGRAALRAYFEERFGLAK
ncbi:MAG TPA: HEAT repeat domain-containing protein [Gemmataceae bacterium]|jgi:HEAT repeat protein|nr:HEAT repeat domain-containing protein [Gemmataceae bacterium]